MAQNNREMAARTSMPVPFQLKHGQDHLVDYLINEAGDVWEAYVEHPFIVQLGKGTLPMKAFIHYLRQAYLYLLHYARIYAIAAYKAKSFEEIAASAVVIQSCVDEVKVNIRLCAAQGVTKEEVEQTKETNACIAYSRYILDVASAGDILDLRVATTPCLIGYGEIGKRLSSKPDDEVDRSGKNEMYRWAATYAQEEYQTVVRTGRAALEGLANANTLSERRKQELARIFRQATELEISFWDDALAHAS